MSAFRYRLAAAPVATLDRCGVWPRPARPVAYVVERANWSTRWDGTLIRDAIEREAPGTIEMVDRPALLARRLVHFGSQFQWIAWMDALARSNRFVVTYFHGKREDGDDMARHVDRFLASLPRVEKVVTAARLIEDRLLAWGVPRAKLARIPIAIDLSRFRAAGAEERAAMRRRYAIADSQICIGSFQKDGTGWGDGDQPKAIKGPDVLLEAVARVAKARPVFVLLTGPARGYVKRGLAKLGVPFAHDWVEDYRELASRYAALDVYLNPSREEGGPKGVLEAMAARVPVVSTRVGMAAELIDDGVSGGLCAVDDSKGLAERIASLPTGAEASRRLDAAQAAVSICDWLEVGRRHLHDVYRPLLGA